jgi:serine/threonine-protein kinase
MTHAGLEIGAVVAGRYEVETVVASGGFATVYVARHLGLRCSVALKVLKPEISGNPKIRKRFLREARVVTALAHPNIVIHHDLGEEPDGRLFLAMEYIDGRSLSNAAREAPLSPARALRVLEQIAHALDFAHARGVLHRDLKPSNVMLVEWAGDPDHAKLIDFGILKHFDELRRIDDGLTTTLTEPRGVIGTPEYMAPEQIRGQPLGPATDQYGLAVVAYELLAGRRPFRAATRVETISAQLRDTPPTIARLACGVAPPPGLDSVLGRALAKAPAARFASCHTFVEALREVLEPVLHVEAPPSFEDVVEEVEEVDAPTVTGQGRRTVEVVARPERVPRRGVSIEARPTAPSLPRQDDEAVVPRRTAPALRRQAAEDPEPPERVRDEPLTPAPGTGIHPRRRLPWTLAAMAGILGVAALVWAVSGPGRSGAQLPPREEPQAGGAVAQRPVSEVEPPEVVNVEATARVEAGAADRVEPAPGSLHAPPAEEAPAAPEAARTPPDTAAPGELVLREPSLRAAEPVDETVRGRRDPAEAPPVMPDASVAARRIAPTRAKVEQDAPKTGTLSVAVRPVGRIWIDGHQVGEGLVQAVRVPAGTRRVRVANAALGLERTVPVVVPPGGRRKLLVDLEKGTSSVRDD